MSVYEWLVALILMAALILKGNKRGSKQFVVVAFVFLFCVMGLRDVGRIGVDSVGSYPHSFRRAGEAGWGALTGKGEAQYNLGFSFVLKLGHLITGGDYQFFIALLSVFILTAYAHFILKYSPSPIQSILYFLGLLYFTLLFDALKQATAMAIILFAFDAVMEKKPGKFVCLVALAGSMHFPALIFLPGYWVGRMKIGRGYITMLAVLLLITFLFRDWMLQLMLKAYGSEETEATMEGVQFFRTKALLMVGIVAAAVALRPPTAEDKVYNALLVYSGIAIVFQTFCGYNNIFERLADYYFHTAIVLIPLVFERLKLKRHNLTVKTELTVKTFAPYVFSAYAIWRFLGVVGDSWFYSPFQFFWQ